VQNLCKMWAKFRQIWAKRKMETPFSKAENSIIWRTDSLLALKLEPERKSGAAFVCV